MSSGGGGVAAAEAHKGDTLNLRLDSYVLKHADISQGLHIIHTISIDLNYI